MNESKNQLEDQCVKYAELGAVTVVTGALAFAVAKDTPVHEMPVVHETGLALGVALMVGGLAVAHGV